MPRQATVTVVIPVFNLAGIIPRTIRSVRRQTRQPDEVIVVDDGSTDGTVLAAEGCRTPGFPLRVLRRGHQGPGAARNAGMAEARGDWTAFLDGDDVWARRKLQSLHDAIAGEPAADLIAHDEFEVAIDSTRTRKDLHLLHNPDESAHLQLFKGCFLSTSTVAVKTALLREAGGFDSSLPSAQDYDLWLRLARSVRIKFIPEALSYYILRPGAVSDDLDSRRACLLRILRSNIPVIQSSVGADEASFLARRFEAALEYNHVRGLLARGRWSAAAGSFPRTFIQLVRTAALGLRHAARRSYGAFPR